MYIKQCTRFICSLLWLIRFTACGSIFAQEYNFLNYGVDDGLAQSQVRDIIQDQRGFLWIGTKGGGVSQFEGLRFRNAGRHDGLASNEVFNLLEDKKGHIWMSHPNGVTMYDGYEFRVYSSNAGLDMSLASKVVEAENGDIWVASQIDGAYRFRNEKFEHFSTANGLPSDTLYGICPIGKEGLAFMTKHTLFLTQGEGFSVVATLPEPVREFNVPMTYHDGKLMVGLGSALYELDPTGKRELEKKLEIPEIGMLLSMRYDDRDRLWLGGSGGLARIANDEKLVFSNVYTAWSMGVSAITQDFDGNIWLGTNGGGFFKFSGEAFQHYGSHTPLESKSVFCMVELDSGELWVGSEKGLYALGRDHKLKTVTIPDQPDPHVRHMFKAKDKKVYLATRDGGYIYSLGKFTPIRDEQGVRISQINYFSQDSQGNIWMAHEEGAALVKGSTAIDTPLDEHWNSHNVSAIEEDSHGNRWYLVRGGGVYCYKKGKWSKPLFEEEQNTINALRMVEDRHGAIWFATYEGLIRYRDGEECSLTGQDGLNGNTIYLVVEDSEGNLWAGTERGINRITLNEQSDPLTIKSFGKREGFKGVETNRGAALLDSKGLLWFGTIEGLTCYDAKEDLMKPNAPRLFISNVQIQLKNVDWARRSDSINPWSNLPPKIELRPGESDVRIDFIGVSLSTPQKVRYKYRLLPDTTWSPLIIENYASFSTMDYGSYTFQVQAVNTEGLISSEVASLPIHIPTPITSTIWFQLALLASGFILVYVLVRARLNSSDRAKHLLELTVQERTEALRNANRIKSDFLAKMSHEIRTPMNGVIGMTDLLRRTNLNDRQRKFVDNIRISGQNLLALINDILDFSRIESGKLQLESTPLELRFLIEEVLDILAFGAYAKGLELLYWVDHDIRGPIFGDPARLKQILVNLVGNAIKFSEKGQVVVIARLLERNEKEASIQISVRDSGIGIPADKFDTLFESFSQVDASTTRKYGGSGLGLAISHGLATKMGGRMWVESEPGKGAEFFFTLVGGLSAPWNYLGKDHPAFELVGQKIAIAIANREGKEIILRYFTHWEIEPLVYESVEAITDALVEGTEMNFLLVDTRLFTEHHLKAARQFAETCARHKVHFGLLCEPAIAIALEESINEYGWLLSKPLKRDDLLNALLHRRVSQKSASLTPEGDPDLGSEVPMRILIAEDNPINMDVAQGMLRNLGYEPAGAENGLEAIKAVKSNTYDVVLMDVQMPEMDGLEATRQLVNDYPRESRPLIVAMTANAMESDRQRCLEAGMDTFISKPFVMDELINLVQRIRTGELPMPAYFEEYQLQVLGATPPPFREDSYLADAPINTHPIPATTTEPSEGQGTVEEAASENGQGLTSLDMLMEVSNGDNNFIRGILQKLVTKLPEAIQELRDALAEKDWETIRATSHRTKSSAAYSGAADLKEKFRVLEHMAREQEDLDQIPARLDELEEYVGRVVEELKGHLEKI